jgi:hypothetical protein
MVLGATFFFRTVLCLIAGIALALRFIAGAPAVAQGSTALPAEPYSLSYAAGGYDARGNFLGGTVLMNLAAFEGRLYAGIGYWMDRPKLFGARFDPRGGSGREGDSYPVRADPDSAAQLVVLDSKSAQWRQEYAFSEQDLAGAFKYKRLSTMEAVQFHRFDGAGNIVGNLAEMLVAGLGGPSGAVYTQKSPGNWEDTRLPGAIPIRSLALHYDRAERTERLYASGGSLDPNVDWGIYSGVFDPTAPGRIRWDPKPESIGPRGRAMSMVECNGVLFAAARPSILRRDDAAKAWQVVYSYPVADSFDLSKYASGFRGLTCTNAPDGKKVLLSGFEGVSGDILRIDLQTGTAAVELQTRQFLTQQWGVAPAKSDIIAGYNDIPIVKSGPSEVRLLGLLALNPNAMNEAWFLSRTAGSTPRYELHEVRPPAKWPYSRSDGALWSVVAIAVSPFPEDQGQVLYLGGYDGHFQPDHNTAWLDRVGVDTALTPYAGTYH